VYAPVFRFVTGGGEERFRQAAVRRRRDGFSFYNRYAYDAVVPRVLLS